MEERNRSRSRINPSLILILVGALLLIIAAVFMLTQNQKAAVVQPTLAALVQPTQAADVPYPDVKRISQEDAKAAYDQGGVVFLDVRTVESFDSVHVKDAISLPEAELDSRWTELSAGTLIITYCT